MARFEQFIAWRYIVGVQGRAEGRGFLRFITYVAIGGVAIGVAALLLALSIVHGFSQEIQDKIIGWGAHIQVASLQDAPLESASARALQLASVEGVASVAPVVQEFVLIRTSARDIEGVSLSGVDVLPSFLAEHLVDGNNTFEDDDAGRPGIVIGRQLARLLGVEVGDVVTLFSVRREGAGGGMQLPKAKPYHVAGLFETSLVDYDERFIYGDLSNARSLLRYGPDQVTRFDLHVKDLNQVVQVAMEINAQWEFPLQALTVYEFARGLFAWVDLQKVLIPVVILTIIVVAAFNIIGALLMVILEKTMEVGILRGLGASAQTIRALFLRFGLLIGVVGTVIGETLALGLGLLQKHYDLIPLPAEAYYMDSAPIALKAGDFALVAVIALALCGLAAYIPARIASRIVPIRAIRFR